MGIDIQKMKEKLHELTADAKTSALVWKPKPGDYTVRVVPYKYNVRNPFVELYFHYIDKKTYLSPVSFGKPDPIMEFAQELQKTGDKEDWKRGKNLEPKLRTFVPLLVRKEEDKGVRFWGFGKTVYTEFIKIISHEDYGDITDINTGRDIEVSVLDAKVTKKTYNETKIFPRGKTSPAVTTPAGLELIKNQHNILDAFHEYSYEELRDVWENHLQSGAPEPTDGGLPNIIPADIFDSPIVENITVQAARTEPVMPAVTYTPSPQEGSPAPKQHDPKSIADEFDKLF